MVQPTQCLIRPCLRQGIKHSDFGTFEGYMSDTMQDDIRYY